ncbi:Ig-like domain-containing protein [Paraperlucidibaca sp.]|uniref:Ig-like domain-containing protein n=1 Tax=Paraperlucidibaca sp. TaxID=2708021 RepID=UPI0030F37792
MSKLMITFTLLCSGLLASCGGDSGTITNPWQAPKSLIFAYPYPGQTEVPTSAVIVLRFSEPLEQAVLDDISTRLHLLHSLDGSLVPVSYQGVDGGQGLLLRSAAALTPNSSYRLELAGNALGSIDPQSFESFRFHTAGAQAGFAQAIGSGGFALLAATPLDQPSLLADIPDAEQPNDMSTLRMAFNRALDPRTTVYGNEIQLLDNHGNLIDSSIYLQGRYLVLDPANDLSPVEHHLILNGVRSQSGELLDPIERSFTPTPTYPRATSILKVGTLGEEQPELLSRLTGSELNEVPVQSFVLGDESFTALSADLAADLGFVPNFANAVPLRIPAGSVLRGSPVDVRILGEVPAGIDTGEVLITLISDANGYLIRNPFSNSPSAPSYVLLNMDAAMTAEGNAANAALSQNLLNIQVVGLAIVENGVLMLEAVSVVEPEVLGLETASGLLSFRMEAYADQRNTPTPETDSRALQLQSWAPGADFQPNARPGDPIILNFNKPLNPASVFLDGAIQVSADGMIVSRDVAPLRHDGATVIIDGSKLLQHNKDIQVVLTSLLRDTHNNPLNQDETLNLRLDDLYLPGGSANNLRAPIVTGVFPGYPCAMSGAQLTGPRESWKNGRCTGGKSSDPLLPVLDLFEDLGLRTIFSRDIDPGTVNENTFLVERRIDTNTWEETPGHLNIQPQRIDFHPNVPWQRDSLYRFTLRSASSGVNCGINAICSPDGAPLQTRQISQSSSTAPGLREGGPNLTNHFVIAGEASRVTLVSLRSLPVVDVNANLVFDEGQEQGATSNGGAVTAPANHLQLQVKKTSGVVTQANVGCSIGEDCPEKRFAWVGTGALQAGVRSYDPSVIVNRRLLDGNPATNDMKTGAVLAQVFPTSLSTTNVFLEARALGLITIPLDTGPLILRLEDDNGQPITGYITDTPDGPWFSTTFNLLIDAPELEPRLIIELGHDIRSKRVSNVALEGPLRFVDDGRLILKVRNPDPLLIPANISLGRIGLGGVELEVPPLAVDLTFTFLPVKDF